MSSPCAFHNSSTRAARRALAVTARGESRLVKRVRTTLDLANRAIEAGVSLRKLVADLGVGKAVDLARALKEKRVLAPIDCKDPAHLMVSGTGLTHLGSAEGRDQMHRDLADPAKPRTRCACSSSASKAASPPAATWARSPNGSTRATARSWSPPEGDLVRPSFALDGGEEPEIAGVYVIDRRGRAGAASASRSATSFPTTRPKRENYLWLAHSKLRPASLGPELLVGDLPLDVQGVSRIRRGREIVWEKPFLSGEQNMAHTIANLEAHHFKYAQFRRPGDAHVHFFGTATLSFSDGFRAEKGDVFEIASEVFGLPLRNRLWAGKAAKARARAL